MKYKNALKRIFKPSSEKIFVAAMPLFLIVPIIVYVVSNFLIGHQNLAGKIFFLVGYISYSFVSIFAIPFEDILQYLGMMQFGGGIFDTGFRGMDLGGVFLVQLTYSIIFYSVFSMTSFFRDAKKTRKVGYSYGKRS